MKVTILGSGTSQGVPVIGCHCKVCSSNDWHDKRLRSSAMIEVEDKVVIIDSGPDFRYQMLRAKVERIDAILFTHYHKDHTGGLDDVRAFNYTSKKAINIYAEQKCIDVIKKDFDYAFAEIKYPGVPDIDIHAITLEPFEIEGVRFIPIRGMHYKMPILGYRIGDFCYLTDMNHIDKCELEKLKGVDTLVINALRREEHLSHFTLSEAIEVAERVGVRRCFLTHMSHQLGLHKDLLEELPSWVTASYDGLEIEL